MDSKAGRAAYEAFAGQMWRLPVWDDLPEATRQAWEAAAMAAIDWWHADRDLEPPRETGRGESLTALAGRLQRYEAVLERIAEAGVACPCSIAAEALAASRPARGDANL